MREYHIIYRNQLIEYWKICLKNGYIKLQVAMIAAQAKCLILTQFILRIPDHQYDFVAYSNGVAINYGSPNQKQEWIKWSGDIDLFFVCQGSGKTTLADMIKAIKIYPNPAKEELNIDGLSMANCKVEMYDILGNLVKSDTLQTGLQKINLSNTSKGLYLVKVKDPKGNPLKTIKLIVE